MQLNLNKENIKIVTDKIIIVFLLIQIFSVSFSIALSSIAFGIWGGLWIIQIIASRKAGIPEIISKDVKLISVFILLFFISDFISLYFAVIPEGAFIGLKRFLLYMIFFAMIAKIKDKETLMKLITVILIVFTAISVYEIILYVFKFPEEAKTQDISLIRLYSFAFFLTTAEMKMLVFVTLFPLLFIRERIFIQKKYLIISLSIIFVAMYLTQSRNVFLSLIICSLIFGLFINKKFLIYLLIFVTAVLLVIPSQFRSRITSIVDPAHPSNASRLIMWGVGWQMFKDHPFTGVGDNEITQVYKMYKQPEFHGEGSHLHSNYFMVLATKGIFGLIFFIAVFFTLFLKHFKYFKNTKDKSERYLIFGCILSMISFHISGIFEWIYGDWEVLTLFLFIVSIPFVLYNLNNLKEPQSENNNLKT